MQSPHLKYYQLPSQETVIFYQEGRSLYYRHPVPGGWGEPQLLATDVCPGFSIANRKNECYLLFATEDTSLILARTSDFIQWEKKRILTGKKELTRTHFLLIPDDDALHMIYPLPTETMGIQSLVYISLRNGVWEQPRQIDRFLPFSTVPFFAGRVSDHHWILYYRTSKNTVSARELLLSPYTAGSISPVIQTSFPCTDLSIINDTERIHLLYTIKGMFRSQVVYQYKQSNSISTPRVLWEDYHCEQCCVYKKNGKLHLMWTANQQPYLCSSENNGTSFGTIEKYTASFPRQTVKGSYLSAPSLTGYYASEGFGDVKNYYALTLFEQPSSWKMPEDASDATVLLDAAESKFDEPDEQMQIQELTRLLNQRADELSAVNAKWREYTEKLEQENKTLKNNVYVLEAEKERLIAANRSYEKKEVSSSELPPLVEEVTPPTASVAEDPMPDSDA